MERSKYTKRFVARILAEAATPLAVGSGESSIMTDSLVAIDINGLPYIPGTSIAGVLRHSITDSNMVKNLMGYQEGKKGLGSRLSITDAIMVGKEGQVLDGIQTINFEDDFYKRFKSLPIRQHVRISHLGAADTENKGKFDCQVVFKGTRFVFEIEIAATEDDTKENYDQLMKYFMLKEFRIGGGTHNGYGKIDIVDIKSALLNLTGDGLQKYLNKSSLLSDNWDGFTPIPKNDATDATLWNNYDMFLHPRDFFLFGSGFSDDEADMTPVEEPFIVWNEGKPCFKEGTLIPASSIKGALAHRTAFYWNKANKFFADKQEGRIGEKNDAVVAIFGSIDNESDTVLNRGQILIDDIIMEKQSSKILNHVSIDRFTGGALDGALFTEKATFAPEEELHLHIAVASQAFEKDPTIKEAFEKALSDLKTGLLPLGGGVNRGNGIFTA